VGLCPRLIFINRGDGEGDKLIEEYLRVSDGLLLDVEEVGRIRGRKGINGNSEEDGILLLTSIIYEDITRK
jgi:hypothetical protein